MHDGLTRGAGCTRTYVSITSYIPQHFGLISAANMDRLRYQHGPLLANPANFLHPDLIVTLRRVYQRLSKARHSDQSASIHRNPTWSRNQTAARTDHIHRPYPMHLITYDIAFLRIQHNLTDWRGNLPEGSRWLLSGSLGLYDRRFNPTRISKSSTQCILTRNSIRVKLFKWEYRSYEMIVQKKAMKRDVREDIILVI